MRQERLVPFKDHFQQRFASHHGTADLETVVDFGENQPFADAEMVRPSIVIVKKGLTAPEGTTFRRRRRAE